MSKSVLEGVQCIAEQSMKSLDKISESGAVSPEDMAPLVRMEQLRATYALCTVMARIHEALVAIGGALTIRNE